MNEILLNAILNLFAIQAALHGVSDSSLARAFLERYLRQHLRLSQPQVYLDLFQAALDLHQDSPDAQLLESVAKVAARLRTTLPRFEQYVLLLRFVELALQAGGGQPPDLVAGVVARHLAITPEVVDQAVRLCRSEASAAGLGSDFLVVSPAPPAGLGPCRLLARPDWQGGCAVLHLAEAGGYFLKPLADANLTCDGVPLDDGTFHVLAPGAVIRDQRGTPVYHSEIAGAFLGHQHRAERLVFQGQRVRFCYPGSDSGLHDFSFCETGGRLIGVMGGSGAGKSTLLGILNGQRRPDSGQVLVNGIDLHRDPQRLEGVIGYVPQDDLLFEDLTVFDNLYLSACLCLANLSPQQRAARVEEVLRELKQLEIRDLKVGTPLDKTISGGQRKRLNIALELIREPSILFVDEPTSGLSSTDSENVMGLLKAQAAKGRLVIAVIHQPSSRIYKMFDRLWVLDQGGRPIYDGNPLDALVYFRRATHKAGQEEYACPHCGNVHPEQLFEIIEEREVDQQGFPGPERKVPAQEWHRRYLAQREQDQELQRCAQGQAGQAECRLWRPGVWGQAGVFFRRNLKSRLANRMYLAINLIEPPLLALLAALLCRGAWGGEYAFGDNPNMGIYFFISVVVALFMGLSVSAEEINRDRKILVRERFLNLSWPAYIAAKALYLALVSALQMAVYTLLANTILQVPDMYLVTWLVLWACSLASCLLGLNISAALKSAVTIYILIPLLLVPQIMLGGAVVPFDQLVRRDADDRNTPWVADLMPSRWGYEALVVTQFTGNRFHARFFADDCAVRQSDYLRDRHMEELRGLADYPFLEDEAHDREAKTAQALRILANELPRLAALYGLAQPIEAGSLTPATFGRPQQEAVKEFLDQAEQAVRQRRQAAAERLRANEDALSDELGAEGLAHLKRTYHSGELAKLALNLQTLEDLRLGRGRVVQLALPACQEPESTWGQAQFLAATKKVGDWRLSTLPFNLGVLGLMTLLLYAALYVALLSRAMEAAGAAFGRLRGLARPGGR
ncbi:MAG: ATP-binding cassette domain-containing protein [Desulfarculus sp.]|nr:ATP-binding cassette domain-containing protein [Desulfarculus sp.]